MTKYYKNNSQVVAIEPHQIGLVQDTWIEMTKEEIEAFLNPVPTNEQRIELIKAKAQSLILEKYSLEKQSSANLGLYGQEYLDTMKSYILNIITISNKAEINGILLEDINWNLEGGN